MAYIRYDRELLGQLRDAADLVALIAPHVALKRSGKLFVGLCPFHEEKSPSFNVNPTLQLFICRGCGARGDAIVWLRKHRNLSFHDAVRELSTRTGIALPVPDVDPNRDQEGRRRRAAMYQALKSAHRMYLQGLAKSPQGLAYLQDRRGLSMETLQQFGIGVVGPGIVRFFSEQDRQSLLDCGLAIQGKSGLFDRFRYRLMIPLHNEQGALISFAGRSLLEKPDRTPKYLNGSESELFIKSRELFGFHHAKAAIRQDRTAVVVEGYFDVMGLHQAGETRAVGLMGKELTPEQLARLLRHADTLIFAFDGDTPGKKAALAAALNLLPVMHDLVRAIFVFLPDGEDPDTYVQRAGLEAWQTALSHGRPLSTLLGLYVAHRLDPGQPESQVLAAKKATDVLDLIRQAPLFRRALRQHLESLVGITLEEREPHGDQSTT